MRSLERHIGCSEGHTVGGGGYMWSEKDTLGEWEMHTGREGHPGN